MGHLFGVKNVLGLLQHVASAVKKGVINMQQSRHNYNDLSSTVVKNLLANAGDARNAGSIPGLGRSPGEGNDNKLQYSCLKNSINRGA